MSLEKCAPFQANAGDDFILPIRLCYKQSKLPFDLTGANEIVIIIPNLSTALAPYTELKLSGSQVTVVNAGGGFITVPISGNQSLNLAQGTLDLVCRITLNSKQTTVNLPQSLTINPPRYPLAP